MADETILPLRDERGVAMVEYSIGLLLVALAVFGAIGAVGDAAVDLYTDIGNAIHAIFG